MEHKEEIKEQPQDACCAKQDKKCARTHDTMPDKKQTDDGGSHACPDWQTEKADLIATLQRAVADFDNYKKRAAKEKQEIEAQAAAGLIIDLLPTLDNFEIALSIDKDPDANARKGRELIYASLVSALEKKGVACIDALGKPFDPRMHEALLTGPGDEKNKVIEVLQKGYALNGKVIRTAKVKISA